MTTISDLDPLFDSHPSLNASLQDFEAPRSASRSPSNRDWSPPSLTSYGQQQRHHRRLSSDISRVGASGKGGQEEVTSPSSAAHQQDHLTPRHNQRPDNLHRRSTANTQVQVRHGLSRHGDPSLPPSGAPIPFGYPSQHSGFRSERDGGAGAGGGLSESESEERQRRGGEEDAFAASSTGRFSPPAWRRDEHGRRDEGFWNRRRTVPADLNNGSRHGSPEDLVQSVEGADLKPDLRDLDRAAKTRLPTGSLSPLKGQSPKPPDETKPFATMKSESGESDGNFIRFAVRAEVQHRTEPIEAAVTALRNTLRHATKSYTSTLTAILVSFLSIFALRALFHPPTAPPVPDLVKVAGLARSFEPLIYYSENGVSQIGELQATGVAVWDLSESVRSTNMTSGPMIVKELDELSDTLKSLAIELTRFFSNVDGDVDSILIVMDWARRELATISSTPPTHISTAFANIHTLLSNIGVLESPAGSGQATTLGALTTTLFGPTASQRTRTTLTRTFHEFLAVLEDAINSELEHALRLFALFTVVENRFANLARTVGRETTAQESAQDELLSSLWTKILGGGSGSGSTAALTRKFERNRELLASIRRRTVANLGVLRDHERKLLTLKANLESLRRKLVGPLLRGNGSRIGLEEQIKGLEEASGYLGGVREKQKGRLMGLLYGNGNRGDGNLLDRMEAVITET